MAWEVARFVWRRGEGSKRRVLHLAGFDRLGRFAGALCGTRQEMNTSANVPFGKRVCKRCKLAEQRLQ